MQAPKLRSMFRNVRTEPRRFVFRSRHLPELDAKWSERKEQIEAELAEQPAPETANNRPIRFQSANRPSSSTWRRRRRTQISGARYAILRAALIASALVWLAWKGIQWIETSDFSGVLKWMENA